MRIFQIRTISDKLLASNAPKTKKDLLLIKEKGVDCIVDLRIKNKFLEILTEKYRCWRLGIKHVTVPIKLFEEMPNIKIFNYINNLVSKQNKILIHCNSGRHRTNLICAGLSILRKDKTLDEAIQDLLKNDYYVVKIKSYKKNNEISIAYRKFLKLKERLFEFKDMFSHLN